MELELSADYRLIPGVRACIARNSYNFGFKEREAYQIELIVDEICNNALEHGGLSPQDKLKVICNFDEGYLDLAVKDKGKREFNLEEILVKERELLEGKKLPENFPVRGRGLTIVKKFVDSITIETEEEGRIVKIVKKKN